MGQYGRTEHQVASNRLDIIPCESMPGMAASIHFLSGDLRSEVEQRGLEHIPARACRT